MLHLAAVTEPFHNPPSTHTTHTPTTLLPHSDVQFKCTYSERLLLWWSNGECFRGNVSQNSYLTILITNASAVQTELMVKIRDAPMYQLIKAIVPRYWPIV